MNKSQRKLSEKKIQGKVKFKSQITMIRSIYSFFLTIIIIKIDFIYCILIYIILHNSVKSLSILNKRIQMNNYCIIKCQFKNKRILI